MAQRKASGTSNKPLLEWIAGIIGLMITVAILGFVAWQAIEGPERRSPVIEVHATGVTDRGSLHIVEIEAVNRSSRTGAAIEVQGRLVRDGIEIERSSVTFDYVPGNSRRTGGLFFRNDPRTAELDLRPVGYSEP